MDGHGPRRSKGLRDIGVSSGTDSSQPQGSSVGVNQSDAVPDRRRSTIAVRRQPRWRDAAQASAQLTLAERETLVTLIRMPLATVKLLEQLDGLRGGAAVYRRIARLRAAGLVAELRPPIQPRHSPRLLYVTDLGLATIAICQHLDPVEIARSFRVRGPDLLGRLPGLPTLLASHRLLGAIAMAGSGWPRLLAWEQPCRRQFRRPTAKAKSRLELPARAVLAWDDQRAAYLLVPDRGTSHLRAYRPMLYQLDALRRALGEPSRLVIATPSRRAGAWRHLLEDVARSRRDTPLRAWIARWEALDADLEGLADLDLQPITPGTSARNIRTPPMLASRADAAIPRPVGELTTEAARPRTTAARLGRLALRITPSDATLLDAVSRHPFLPLSGLAATLGWSTARTRRRRDDLVQRGLVRLLTVTANRGTITIELSELTIDGLRLVAARLGIPLQAAVRTEGLAGGGPAEPIGRRRNLVRYLAHSLGADAVFTHLYQLANHVAAQGGDDQLVLWNGPGACGRGTMRPDGHGLYRRAGELFHFFLEYDRGTSGVRNLMRKLNAYYNYLETERFRRDYPVFPVILVVTTSNAAEARFARAARAASVGRFSHLPLLLTSAWRIFQDPANGDGLLGPIWREADAPFDHRRRWLKDASPKASRQP
jgi:DNA-binding MarR family transcriptional regulator